jgi:hypothetical protein
MSERYTLWVGRGVRGSTATTAIGTISNFQWLRILVVSA